MFGFGALDRWLFDDSVTEVMVNGGREVWVERAGGSPGAQYVGQLDAGVIDTVLERILSPVGRRLDRTHPVVDARLADGSRVCAVLPPVAVDGPCLSVRKFAPHTMSLHHFGGPHLVSLLTEVVQRRCNLLVSGPTSSGKTTLLNAIASIVPAHERIITLEDTAELRLPSAHVLRLETRPANGEGLREVGLDALLRAALRLRPDRLVVGEIRGIEAVELLQALSTGHDGSLATMHANSAVDALARLESLVVRAGHGWPLVAVREQVQRSIDVVVHVHRSEAGVRAIHEIVEVAMPGEAVRRLATMEQLELPLRRGRR